MESVKLRSYIPRHRKALEYMICRSYGASVLRVNKGKLSFEQGQSEGLLASNKDYINEVATKSVDINRNTFKNHLLIPPMGWKALFTNELARVNEGSLILYKEYVPGSVAAHHYPFITIPRAYSARIGADVYVDSFTEDSINYRILNGKRVRQSLSPFIKVHPPQPLLSKLIGTRNILILFSGTPPHADLSTAMAWRNSIESDINTVLVLNSPCNIGLSWAFNKYKMALAKTIVENNKFMSISRKLNHESIIKLHQYRNELTSVLVIDELGYIRWHALGTPTKEALHILHKTLTDIE